MKGHSQRSLAEASGLSKSTVKRLEAGACEPRLGTAEALARCLEVPVRSLFPGLSAGDQAAPSAARAATLRDLRRLFTADPSAEEYRVLRFRAVYVLDALIAEAEDPAIVFPELLEQKP